MKICFICNKPIRIGQKASVLARDIKIIDNNGGYSLLEDFAKNETIVHNECFSLEFTRNKISFCPTEDMSNLSDKVKNVLQDLGEKVSITDVQKFLILNPNVRKIDNILQKWFVSKS